MSTKKKAYQSVSEVQRAWDRAATARAAKPTVPLSFVPTRPAPLYSLMRDDTLRNTSVDWRAHPEILTKSRNLMIDALRQLNISNESVLSAMAKVPRHVFVDDAFYLRAYDDDALPIGHGQTISHPSTVARMVSLMYGAGGLNRVLEIGTGCGYQAAVLAHCAAEVYSIERIAPLYDLAAVNLYRVQSILPTLPQIRFGDGMLGWLEAAPFDAIIIAAAGLKLPQTMLEQLRIGGILVAPVYLQANDVEQHLVRITRIGAQEWQREVIDVARFVPLLGGVETRG
jgi:protein-L-isoaspartate(D-aspartate) O-methyltransferase